MRKGIFHGVIEAVQDLGVSQMVANAVQPAIKKLFHEWSGGASIKEGIHGDWLGHPLHPVLTDLPIGAWTTAAIFDALPRNENSWHPRAADACVAIGIVTALPTALTGLTDWSETSGRAARVGAAHATCNIIATLLYASSLLARRSDRRRGVLLAYAGFGAMSLGGVLGGHLVFSGGVGVEPDVQTPPRTSEHGDVSLPSVAATS